MRLAGAHSHGRRSGLPERLRGRRHRDVRSGASAPRTLGGSRILFSAVQEKGPSLNLKFLHHSILYAILLLGLSLVAQAADRNALTFTAYDLQTTITPSSQEFDVSGKV